MKRELVKRELVVEHVRQIWAVTPLPTDTAQVGAATVEGIEQQVAAGSRLVHYMIVEDGRLTIKMIEVEE